jgi:uncharacterized protein involved in outer membrane biogenesis
MGKALRISAIALALVLAGVIGLAWLVATLDLDQHRADLAAWLSDETGFEVRIDGSLAVRHRLRQVLWPQLTAQDISVWSQADGPRELLARVDELVIVANPLDLLLRGLVVDEVILRGAEVVLVRDARGRDRWMSGEETASDSGIELHVRKALVEDGAITLRNALADAETRLDLERLEWTAGEADAPGELQVDGELEGLPLSIVARLQPTVGAEEASGGFDVRLEGALLGASVEATGSVAGANLRDTNLALELKAPSLTTLARWAPTEKLELPDLGPLRAAATLQSVNGILGLRDIDVRVGDRQRAWLEATGTADNLEGARDVRIALDFGTQDLRHLHPWLREPTLELDSFTGTAVLTDANGSLGLEAMVLKAGREEILDLHVEGQVDDLAAAHEIDLQVKLHVRYLADLGSLVLTALPLAGPLDFSGRITGGRERASVEDLALTLGESGVDGSIVYRHPVGQRPRVEVKLKAPRIRLADLGIFPESYDRLEAEEVPVAGPTDDLPFDNLKHFDADLRLDVAHLAGRAGFDAEQLRIEAGLQDGLLDVRRFAVAFKGGHFEVTGRVDARAVPPVVSLRGDGQGVTIGSLMAQVAREDRMSGRGDLNLDLRTSGASRQALIEGLHGSAVVLVSDGRISSEWANAMVRDATRALFSSTWKQGDQAFECLATSLTATDGVIPEALALLDAEETRIVGRGSIDLRARRLDLQFTPHPRDPGLLSLAAQVRVRGDFSNPRVTTNPLSVPMSAGTSLFRNAFRLPGVNALSSLALPRQTRSSSCNDLREELARARRTGDAG